MRSRYSAFVLQDERYLLATWHSSKRPARVPFTEDQTWLALTVIETKALETDLAEVEFVARTRVGTSGVLSHHERSRFIREGGAWFYVDGVLK